jgi:hypothetical protein
MLDFCLRGRAGSKVWWWHPHWHNVRADSYPGPDENNTYSDGISLQLLMFCYWRCGSYSVRKVAQIMQLEEALPIKVTYINGSLPDVQPRTSRWFPHSPWLYNGGDAATSASSFLDNLNFTLKAQLELSRPSTLTH